MKNRSTFFSETYLKLVFSACLMVLLLFIAANPVTAASPKIRLDRNVCTVKKGKSIRLRAKILKKKYKKRKIIWSSTKKSVATVSKKGVIRGKKNGKATITARIKGTKFKAKCLLTVVIPVKKVEVNTPRMVLFVGEKNRISARVNPSNATTGKLEFISSAPNIVSVIGEGYLTAVAPGEAEITVRSTDGTGVYSVVKVIVNNIVDTSLTSSDVNSTIKKMMNLIEGYSAFIKQYGSLCYKNGKNPVLTYEAAMVNAQSNIGIPLNCASPANWVLYDLGFMPKGQIYGTPNGFVITSTDSRSIIESNADFIKEGDGIGSCVQDASDSGALYYGDILSISINGINHTVVYAGRSEEGHALVYEAGGIAQSIGYSVCGCGPIDYSKSSYSKYAITEIIRFR